MAEILQLAQRKSEVSGEFYAETPTVPVFSSPDIASARLRPALIATSAPLKSRAPRCRLGPSTGVSFYLVSIALVAAATIGVFFGMAFALLRQPAIALAFEWPVHGRGSDVGSPPQGGLPGGEAAAPRGPKTAQAAAKSPHLDVAPATPGPAQKPSASVPTETGAQIPAALRPPDRQSAQLLARGDVFLRAGDIASARLFYERAADAGDGQAALRMAATFDPAFLASAGLRNLRGDPAQARFWYHRALGLGASEAEFHLNSLETK
jgi:hypothetical protein